ncbi:MAG: signal peptidase I [Acidimicrobiales bacterium]
MNEPDFPAPPPSAPVKRRFSPLLAISLVVLVAGVALVGLSLLKVLGYGMGTLSGATMEPTVPAGTSVIYRPRDGGEVRRGDLVLIEAGRFEGRPAGVIRRVIAVGGDRASCCDPGHRIQVNGRSVTEPYLDPRVPLADNAVDFSVTVPPGSVFVAADNRSISDDSRTTAYLPGGGAIPLSKVDGVIVAKGALLWAETLKPTTAFTDAGLPGAATEDTGPVTGRRTAGGGAALFLLGFVGAVVTAARSARKRRIAAAVPPVH